MKHSHTLLTGEHHGSRQLRFRLAALILVLGGLATATAQASLEERIAALEAELASLKQATAARSRVDHRGVQLASPDNAYRFSLRGAVHSDARFYTSDEAVNDAFLFRRIRPTLDGQLGPAVSFRITPELAGSSVTLLDAYADLRISDALIIRAGQFKSPISLERLQSGNALSLVERAYVAEVAANRDLGVQLHGRLANGTVSYAAGIFNGAPDGRNSPNGNADDNFEVAGRLFVEPFRNDADSTLRGLGIGLAGSTGKREGAGNDFLPRYRSPGQQTVFSYLGTTAADGRQERLSPQGWFYAGPFGLLGEYIVSRQRVVNTTTAARARFDHEAWQLTATYVLTGENAGYGGVTPNRPFALGSGGWGAWELALRWTELDLDDDSFLGFADPERAVANAETVALGLNWYATRNLRSAVTFQRTRFDGGAAGGDDRNDERLLFARLQYAF